MRVAIISETFLPKVDGIVKVTCLLLDHLSKRGVNALVIAPRYGESARPGKIRRAASSEIWSAQDDHLRQGRRPAKDARPQKEVGTQPRRWRHYRATP